MLCGGCWPASGSFPYSKDPGCCAGCSMSDKRLIWRWKVRSLTSGCAGCSPPLLDAVVVRLKVRGGGGFGAAGFSGDGFSGIFGGGGRLGSLRSLPSDRRSPITPTPQGVPSAGYVARGGTPRGGGGGPGSGSEGGFCCTISYSAAACDFRSSSRLCANMHRGLLQWPLRMRVGHTLVQRRSGGAFMSSFVCAKLQLSPLVHAPRW
mmetsp:Transcript_29704/g.85452  ORF Transcript_29704/g.85452 Transcript_29704/m.85452 type:complete len:206 (+) Transcript_29704:1728-2345(+)